VPLNMRVIDWLPLPPPPEMRHRSAPAVGIELEYEEFDEDEGYPYLDSQRYWRAVGDGSLRNGGRELVSIPLSEDSVAEALSVAESIVNAAGAVATTRCGLHTHMNMWPYTAGQMHSLITLYALIEPTIFSTYAIGRESNIFAVPLWRNTHQQQVIHAGVVSARSSEPSSRVLGPVTNIAAKYSALNMSSLIYHGTLEMRQPYCSNNFEAIQSWVEFCFRLVREGTSYNDPVDVHNDYGLIGLEGFQERLFGDRYEVNSEWQEQAEEAAIMTCGYVQERWQDLTWEIR